MKIYIFDSADKRMEIQLKTMPGYIVVHVISGDEVIFLYDHIGEEIARIDSGEGTRKRNYNCGVYHFNLEESKDVDNFLKWQGMGITYCHHVAEMRRQVFSTDFNK